MTAVCLLFTCVSWTWATSLCEGLLRPKTSDLGGKSKSTIKYLYIGLFDGHGGPGCALKASKELHQIVHEGLDDALHYIVKAHETEMEGGKFLYLIIPGTKMH